MEENGAGFFVAFFAFSKVGREMQMREKKALSKTAKIVRVAKK